MVFILNILLQFTARGKENETLELLYQEHIQESLENLCTVTASARTLSWESRVTPDPSPSSRRWQSETGDRRQIRGGGEGDRKTPAVTMRSSAAWCGAAWSTA